MSNHSFLDDHLSRKTSIFGLRLWVIIGICVGASIVLVLFLISLWFTSRRSNGSRRETSKTETLNNNSTIPKISKEIQEIRIDRNPTHPALDQKPHNPDPLPESDPVLLLTQGEESHDRIHIEIGKDNRIEYPERVGGSGRGVGEANRIGDQGVTVSVVPEVSHLGWGHWYTLRELEDSTNGFSHENVIGEGGYGIVYHGVLGDKTQVAVKNLLNNRYFTAFESKFKFFREGSVFENLLH